MIVLDTNVISELMRPAPHGAVVAWLDRQPSQSVWTTSLCVFEVSYGLGLMPEGRRQRELQARFEQVLQEDLAGRVLDFDTTAAFASAAIAGKTKAQGKTLELRDLLIAGTVAARRGTLASRNTKHFADTGISLINPWEDTVS